MPTSRLGVSQRRLNRRLSGRRLSLEPLLEMVDHIGRDELDPLLRTYDGGQLRPLALEAFLAFDLLAFGDLFWIVVKTTPPPPARGFSRKSARSAALRSTS